MGITVKVCERGEGEGGKGGCGVFVVDIAKGNEVNDAAADSSDCCMARESNVHSICFVLVVKCVLV